MSRFNPMQSLRRDDHAYTELCDSGLDSGLDSGWMDSQFAAPAKARPHGTLNIWAQRWLAELPIACRPMITALRHPHVINRLSLCWDDPRELSRYFKELLIDSSTSRFNAGVSFALEVMDELFELQSFSQRGFQGAGVGGLRPLSRA